MTIKPVTSLADLEFKAKTDKHYQQLAILGCRTWDGSRIRLYSTAIKKLQESSVGYNPHSCQSIVKVINESCNKIKPEKDTATILIKKKEVARIIENLKKLGKKPVTRKATKKTRRHVARTV